MHIFHSIADLRTYLRLQRQQGKTVGFVPTMGALHEGHLSLIEASKAQNDLSVCSIFVNPIQFNNPDDLARYPRTLETDCAMLAPAGCDAVFAPSAEEMYGKAKASDGLEPSNAYNNHFSQRPGKGYFVATNLNSHIVAAMLTLYSYPRRHPPQRGMEEIHHLNQRL